MNKRLVKCAERLGQTKTALGQQAVIALVEAIERANYRMVMPLEFSVSYVPVPARVGSTLTFHELPDGKIEHPITGGRAG